MAALSRGVGSEEGVERARAVLAEFNVQHLRYYGPLAVTDLRTDAECARQQLWFVTSL